MVKLEVAHVAPYMLYKCENFLSLEILVSYWQPVLQKKNQICETSVIVMIIMKSKLSNISSHSFKINNCNIY